MKVEKINSVLVSKLQQSEITKEMKSIEKSDWVVIEEENNKIMGAVGVGGIFHVSSISVSKERRGSGLGKKLQNYLINEAKRLHFSFLIVFVDPRNLASTKLHNSLGYQTIFRIHYSSEIIQDVKILVLRKRGNIIKKILKSFNSFYGMIFLALFLKIFKIFLRGIIGYGEEVVPEPSISEIIKKFEKI